MRQNSYPGKIIRILLLCLNTDMRRWGLSPSSHFGENETTGTVPIVSPLFHGTGFVYNMSEDKKPTQGDEEP